VTLGVWLPFSIRLRNACVYPDMAAGSSCVQSFAKRRAVNSARKVSMYAGLAGRALEIIDD
jgi:hypothetical protein